MAYRTATIREYPDSPIMHLHLDLDRRGEYRWYDSKGADTEISGRTISDAVKQARTAWRSWEFKLKRKNPRQPHKRVRKALRKYVDKSLGLPTQYTPAKVRVDSKGEIDIKFARPPKGKLKNPKRFKVNRKK